MRTAFLLIFALILRALPAMAANSAASGQASPSAHSESNGRSSRDSVEQQATNSGQPAPVNGLLPCPLSVPCRAGSAPAAELTNEPSTTADLPMYGSSTVETAVGASSSLLPCPQSIPCVAPEGPVDLQDFEDDSGQSEGTAGFAADRAKSGPARGTSERAAKKSPRLIGTDVKQAGKHHPGNLDAVRGGGGSEKREVLMAGAAASGDSARGVLAKAAGELAQVNPAQLTAENRPTYEEASEFVAQGRAALQAHDNSAALNLGEKARRLVSGLQPAQPSGRPLPNAAP